MRVVQSSISKKKKEFLIKLNAFINVLKYIIFTLFALCNETLSFADYSAIHMILIYEFMKY